MPNSITLENMIEDLNINNTSKDFATYVEKHDL